MADMIKFYKGLEASLPASGVNGALYITTDEGGIYLGTGTGMKRLGDFVQVANVASLPAKAHENCLYYCVAENILAKWNGTEWKQINKQPTAEEMKTLLGLGSAAYTDATAYDKAGAADEVKAYVGDIPEGYTEETVIAYINKKAEETLNAASGGSSESAASVLAALNTYKAENDPKVTANTNAITAIKDGTAVDSFADVETELAKKVDKVEGKSLVSDTEITKLAGVSEGANKVEKSDTNGNIKVDSAEVVVYTHPEKHAIADVDGLQDALDGKQAVGDYATKTEAQDYADAKDEAIAAAKKAGDDAQATADAKVASVTAGDASVTIGGTTTAPTVAAKLSADADNALTLADDGLKVVIPAAVEYSIVKAENSGDYAAVYNLTKDGAIVGASINIPKDMVVKSGSVVGNEIVLVLNDEESTEIKIPVDSLIEYVTSGSATGDMVVVNVSDDHKVTATITDGTITLAKLTTEVQTAIGKAHSHENADILNGINADKVAAWDNAQANAEATAAGALATARTEITAEIDADVKALADGAVATNASNIAANAEAIATKANSADAYAKTETYTQDEVDAAIATAV